MTRQTVLLMILDGFGYRTEKYGNAILESNIPNIKNIFENNPHTLIHTSGEDVGLPKGQMGNSEVGHTNIGAGRIIYQDLMKINNDIESGKFYKNEEFLKAIEHCKKNNTNLHLFGLLSDGGVHSHINHLFALLDLCKMQDFKRVYIHVFLDGRDTQPKSGIDYVKKLEEKINKIGIGIIASVMGRYYAMDRDKRWDRVKLAYDAISFNQGDVYESALAGILKNYENGITDEFIKPFVLKNKVELEKDDAIIFYNYRPDRAREITASLTDFNFNEFDVKKIPLYYVCMTNYDENLRNVHIAYPNEEIKNTLGEYISNLGKTQLRIAETEKYAHVTFFLNGGREEPYLNEERILIKSPAVATYDLKPEMSAYLVTDKVLQAIESNKYDLIILNFANPDMVGHTGNLKAVIKALEALDKCVFKINEAINATNSIMLITADHGNCEEMYKGNTLEPLTSHTTNPVPLTIVGVKNITLKEGILADLAPTILDLMNLDKPNDMTGNSLINYQKGSV